MSKRTLRRAAERQTRKAERIQQLTAQAAVAAAPAMALEPEADCEVLTLSQDAQFPTESQSSTTAPVAPEGQVAVSQNRRSHHLVSRFCVLPFESMKNFQKLSQSLYEEHNPETDSEQRLVDAMIQHYWLMQRAILLQEELMTRADQTVDVDPKRLSLFVRYQTTHERSYYKAMRELQNFKKQKRQDKIGFESQKRQEEVHEAKVRLTHARAQNLEIDTACRQTMEAPIPGNTRIGFEQLTKACSTAIATVVYENQFKTGQESLQSLAAQK